MPPAPTTGFPTRGYATTADELERIPVLPDSPLAVDAALQREHRRRPVSAAPNAAVAPGRYLGLYAKYVALFVGAGLISGAIVHYPLDNTRYVIIGAFGAVLFALASIFGEARVKGGGPAAMVTFVAASLVLALGIGMISGGIQHFSDIPTRAATLIPLGGLLSVIAFAVRDGHRLSRHRVLPFAVAGSAVLVWLAIGLSQYAKGFDVPASGADHHGATADTTTAAHPAGETEAASDEANHAAADGASTDAAAPSETAPSAEVAPVVEDHSAHGH